MNVKYGRGRMQGYVVVDLPSRQGPKFGLFQADADRDTSQDSAQAAPPLPSSGLDASEALPQGWFEAIDPTYNHPYWYNPTTGERTWQKPQVCPSSQSVTSDLKARSDLSRFRFWPLAGS